MYHWILLVVTLYFYFCTSEWTNTYCQLIQMRYIHFLVTNSILFLYLFHFRHVCAFGWIYTNSVIMYFGTQCWLCSRFAVVCHICIHRVSMTIGWYACLPAVQNCYVWNGNVMYGARYKQTPLYQFDERYWYKHKWMYWIFYE